MARLAISLLGSFSVTLEDRPQIAFATDKVRALLAYLAVESGRPHRREALAALFWPDRPEGMAHNSLRQALFQLRQALKDCQGVLGCLQLESTDVQLSPGCEYWLDVAEFTGHLSACRYHHPEGLSLCESCRERLQLAVALYKGEFLAGFSLQGCLDFDLWQVITQETCHYGAIEALSSLCDYYESKQYYELVAEFTRRKIELEPWRESAHRRRMRALALSGQTGEALLQYQACREILRREFGLLPSQETVRVYERIRSGWLDALHARDTALNTVQPRRTAAPASGELHPRPRGELPLTTSHISPILEEYSTLALLNSVQRAFHPDESGAIRCPQEAFSSLVLEIQKLRAGQVLTAGDLRRLRKALRAAFAALENRVGWR